jgi:hypothetical protein
MAIEALAFRAWAFQLRAQLILEFPALKSLTLVFPIFSVLGLL